MSVEPLASLDRSTLRERALAAVRSAITSGQYRPGDHLGEVDLAAHLGVSRGTVREALRHLQQEGLVTTGARGMLRVSTIAPKEVRELFAVRAALEGFAASEIIASADRAAAVATLRAAVDRMADADDAARGGSGNGAFQAALEADLAFHLLLCELSGNSMLVDTWRHLEGRIRVTIMNGEPRTGSAGAPTMMARDRHAPIVDAIERGDAADAAAVVARHMAAAADQYAPQVDRS
ncbi:MAG TPA: GntR family transcriptional regulator [Pseudonocardia sp.]